VAASKTKSAQVTHYWEAATCERRDRRQRQGPNCNVGRGGFDQLKKNSRSNGAGRKGRTIKGVKMPRRAFKGSEKTNVRESQTIPMAAMVMESESQFGKAGERSCKTQR